MKQSHIEVTERIIERSRPTRSAYLHRVDEMISRKKGPDRLGCANVAHAFAANDRNVARQSINQAQFYRIRLAIKPHQDRKSVV